MPETNRQPCPTCRGEKIIEGICVVNAEWRGTSEDEKDDTQCTPAQECPTCHGTGYVEASGCGQGRE